MKIIADLHIHSRFSRGCSKAITIDNLEKYAKIKGLGLLGTGDFTHPFWFKELEEKLREDAKGILRTKNGFSFIWQTEVSLMYTQGGMGRRIHYVILAPSKETVKQIIDALGKKGRLDYDGRPIFGFSSIELVDMMMNINEEIEIIPAHAWTSHFAIFGSKSGFNSMEECFEDKTKYIHSLETGMSSDPAMNWRLSKLDKFTLVSNSDSHSFWPWRLGREANILDIKELTYKNIIKAIRTREGLTATIETPVEYGKYHYDGHRFCHVCMAPNEAIKHKNICPKCGRKLTIGVLHRVEELADRPEGFVPKGVVPFKSLIPLSEIIAELIGSAPATQKTWKIYYELISKFGSEFSVLLDAEEDELKKVVDEKLANAIMKNREGKIYVKPGYDGEYGKPVFNNKISIKERKESKEKHKQTGLGEFA
jgi:uncharacterized protein (TIGR00375 family)